MKRYLIRDTHFINIKQLTKLRNYLDKQIMIEYKKLNKIEKELKIKKNNNNA